MWQRLLCAKMSVELCMQLVTAIVSKICRKIYYELVIFRTK